MTEKQSKSCRKVWEAGKFLKLWLHTKPEEGCVNLEGRMFFCICLSQRTSHNANYRWQKNLKLIPRYYIWHTEFGWVCASCSSSPLVCCEVICLVYLPFVFSFEKLPSQQTAPCCGLHTVSLWHLSQTVAGCCTCALLSAEVLRMHDVVAKHCVSFQNSLCEVTPGQEAFSESVSWCVLPAWVCMWSAGRVPSSSLVLTNTMVLADSVTHDVGGCEPPSPPPGSTALLWRFYRVKAIVVL